MLSATLAKSSVFQAKARAAELVKNTMSTADSAKAESMADRAVSPSIAFEQISEDASVSFADPEE